MGHKISIEHVLNEDKQFDFDLKLTKGPAK